MRMARSVVAFEHGKRARLLVGGVMVAILLIAGLPIRAFAATWTASLSAVGSTSIAQGLPFQFRASLTNPGTSGGSKFLFFDLVRPNDDGTWTFRSIKVSAAGGATVTITLPVTSAQKFPDLGDFTVKLRMDGAEAATLTYTITAPTKVVPVFSDVTVAAGVATVQSDFQCDTWTAGAAWGDVNGDGNLDLYMPVRTGPAKLWMGDGAGSFVDEAEARGLSGGAASRGLGATFADYDNDGGQDLFVARDDGTQLFHNDGTGNFTDVTASSGISVSGPGFQNGAWGDYDADGFVDLYVVRYSDCVPTPGIRLGTPLPDNLFHNNGDGTFTDVTTLVEHDPSITSDGSTSGYGFQAGWFDYNKDGKIDLYLANANEASPLSDRNRLWRNDGPTGPDGTWQLTDVTSSTGAGFFIASMGLGIGDYDRDQDFDIAISNVGPNVLGKYTNGKFANVAKAARVDRPTAGADRRSVTWGLDFHDLNNDGWLDLYVTNGGLKEDSYPVDTMDHELFVNSWDGKFLDLSAPSGALGPGIGRGVAFGDYDRDGRVDLFVVQQDGMPILYHNDTPLGDHHWLEVRLFGTQSNHDACGARITATLAGGTRLLRGVFCGSTSFGSGNDPAVHFGLGTAAEATQLQIVWPNGLTQTVLGPFVDELVTIVEPGA